MKIILKGIIVICIMCLLTGCAGKGWMLEWEANADGDLELKKASYFEGKNIKCKTTKESAEMETKNLQLPTTPFKF